jgi:hypothetical protein
MAKALRSSVQRRAGLIEARHQVPWPEQALGALPAVTFSAHPWHSQSDRFAARHRAQHLKSHVQTIEISCKI